ncbi:FadR/GntR family transcriptional regulator, partial [Azohydromonas lata]
PGAGDLMGPQAAGGSVPALPARVEEGGGTLVERLHAHVLESILNGAFAPGTRLPTEAELAVRFGVSRATVREALSRLRSEGLIETRRGSGSHVAAMSPAQPQAALLPTVASLADVERYYAFRDCMEAGAAAAAAEHRNAEDVLALRLAFDDLQACLQAGRPAADEDARFHAAIAHATHNPFFITAMQGLVVPIRQYMDRFNVARDQASPARVQAALDEHRAILDAIAQRAASQAAQAMRQHVFNARQRLFEATRLV